MGELKPCPFCGGEARLHQDGPEIFDAYFPDGNGGMNMKRALAYSWFVRCTVCGVHGIAAEDRIIREESGEISVLSDGRKAAIKLWNARAAE